MVGQADRAHRSSTLSPGPDRSRLAAGASFRTGSRLGLAHPRLRIRLPTGDLRFYRSCNVAHHPKSPSADRSAIRSINLLGQADWRANPGYVLSGSIQPGSDPGYTRIERTSSSLVGICEIGRIWLLLPNAHPRIGLGAVFIATAHWLGTPPGCIVPFAAGVIRYYQASPFFCETLSVTCARS